MGSFEAQVDSLSTLASSWCLCSQECGKGLFNNNIIFFFLRAGLVTDCGLFL